MRDSANASHIEPRTKTKISNISYLANGGYTGIVPPVPMPNTEVKYTKADDIEFLEKVGSPR